MKLIPASSARCMIRIESSWSWLPQAPNIMAPRHSGLTFTPVRPRVRCSIGPTLARRREEAQAGGDRGADEEREGERPRADRAAQQRAGGERAALDPGAQQRDRPPRAAV